MLQKKTNLIINITELKIRLFYFIFSFFLIFFISFFYRLELFYLISQFFLRYEEGFIYTSLLEPFIIYFKLTLIFTLIFSFPFFIYIFGFFFFKAMFSYYTFYYFYYFIFIYIISLLLFIFISFVFFPLVLEFLLSFQRNHSSDVLHILLQATVSQYFSFFFNYLLIYLFIVLVPNIVLFLTLLNILDRTFFLTYKFRKYLYFVVLICFLIFAPPDFVAQIFLLPIVFIVLEIFIYITTV
jgi:Sec-independent protein secretion pathway component TatC